MREGSLDAPTRHQVDWKNPDFTDPAKLDEELRRQFDVCHGCRRCFNLCDSFPRLFDLIDDSKSGELDSVSSDDFKPVVDACTLCDMCYLTKCPYVPPHEFNIDFPHLMLRYRVMEHQQGKTSFAQHQLSNMDRNGRLASLAAPIVNWGGKRDNKLTRPMLEAVMGIDDEAELPHFEGKTFVKRAKSDGVTPNQSAPAFGKRKAVIFATCAVNYNNATVGEAARKVLAHNGVETRVEYPGCCGMPHLEHGDIEKVVDQSDKIVNALLPLVDEGYDIIALTASCGLMLKFEWPLLNPDDERLKKLAAATFDISEYIVDVAKGEGLADGLTAVDGGITAHHACHARAQNMGAKAAEMLRLIPDTDIDLIERCAGHGGTFGVLKETYDVAVKVAKPVIRAAKKTAKAHVVSDCPLAAKHLHHMLEGEDVPSHDSVMRHPIEIFAQAYGF